MVICGHKKSILSMKTEFKRIHIKIHVNFPLEGKGNETGEDPKEDFSVNMRENKQEKC